MSAGPAWKRAAWTVPATLLAGVALGGAASAGGGGHKAQVRCDPNSIDDTACCLAQGRPPGCTRTTPPRPRATELDVTVRNIRGQLVRGIVVEVLKGGRRVAGGTTSGPSAELRFRLDRGSYTVKAHTPPAQRPLELRDSRSVTLSAGATSKMRLRISAPCGHGSNLPTTSFAHGGARGYASSGDDVIRGTNGPDRITDANGNDTVCANGGADTIRMFGTGSGRVYAGPGNDIVRLLRLGNRPVEVFGGPGNDNIEGSRAADVLNGDAGNDLLKGDDGRDVLRGGSGDDRLYGGPDVDTLFGGPHNDLVVPGPHADGGSRLDRNAQQLADCGPGRDELLQHDIYAPFVKDLRNVQPGEQAALAAMRASPNLVPSAIGCEKRTPPASQA